MPLPRQRTAGSAIASVLLHAFLIFLILGPVIAHDIIVNENKGAGGPGPAGGGGGGRRGGVPRGYDLWVVRDGNPDGTAAARRRNARGVDLNRNFGTWWAPTVCPGPYCSGPSPMSEPESQALAGFLSAIRPRLVVFFHSEGPHIVDNPTRGLRRTDVLHAYADSASASVANLHCGLDSCTGNATQFVNRTIAGATSFVVELPCHDRCMPPNQVARHVRGFWAAARAVAAD